MRKNEQYHRISVKESDDRNESTRFLNRNLVLSAYGTLCKSIVILSSLFVLTLMRTFRIKLKCGEVVNDMDLIARITEFLDECGWSKYQLAKEANISQSMISSMMKRGNNPTVSTIERCCIYPNEFT